MTENSVICRFIRENKDSWEELLEQKGIVAKTEGHFAIFNYDISCDFSDPVVQEARGIVIDMDNLDVACWPFRKFGNYTESYADKIDWSTARVQEKIDGSIVKLWWNRRSKKWVWSTNGVIDAYNAMCQDDMSFGDLIQSARNFGKIPFHKLDEDCTYIFELVSPVNRVVVRYSTTRLWHIGTRNNVTGEELKVNLGVEQPEEYPLGSLTECVKAARKLNTRRAVTNEGYVVVDGNWNRIKIKSPLYFTAHKLATTKSLSKSYILRLIRDRKDLEVLTGLSPEVEARVRWYQWQYAELGLKVGEKIQLAKSVYEELNGDRKAYALWVKENEPEWSSFMFRALDDGVTPALILVGCSDKMVERYIKDYQMGE